MNPDSLAEAFLRWDMNSIYEGAHSPLRVPLSAIDGNYTSSDENIMEGFEAGLDLNRDQLRHMRGGSCLTDVDVDEKIRQDRLNFVQRQYDGFRAQGMRQHCTKMSSDCQKDNTHQAIQVGTRDGTHD